MPDLIRITATVQDANSLFGPTLKMEYFNNATGQYSKVYHTLPQPITRTYLDMTLRAVCSRLSMEIMKNQAPDTTPED